MVILQLCLSNLMLTFLAHFICIQILWFSLIIERGERATKKKQRHWQRYTQRLTEKQRWERFSTENLLGFTLNLYVDLVKKFLTNTFPSHDSTVTTHFAHLFLTMSKKLIFLVWSMVIALYSHFVLYWTKIGFLIYLGFDVLFLVAY